jgi:hypothetical protein
LGWDIIFEDVEGLGLGGSRNEKDISAEAAKESKGSRFSQEDEDPVRAKGSQG